MEDIPNDRDQIVDGGTEPVYFNFTLSVKVVICNIFPKLGWRKHSRNNKFAGNCDQRKERVVAGQCKSPKA